MYRKAEMIQETVTVKYGMSANYKKTIEKLLRIQIEKKLNNNLSEIINK